MEGDLRDGHPFHCDANSWTVGYLSAGCLVVALATALFWAHRRAWRELFPVICLPACGLALAIAADLFNVPVMGALTQAFNAYRLSALVLPFAALALLILLLGWRERPVGIMLLIGLCALGWALGPMRRWTSGQARIS